MAGAPLKLGRSEPFAHPAGTLLGISALAIPRVGPIAAAGAIAPGAIPQAAAIGAAVGAAAGGLARLLSKQGVQSEDAGYYADRINEGGIFVSVDADTSEGSIGEARDILYRNGGQRSISARTSSA